MEPECTRCAARLSPPLPGSPSVPGFRIVTGDKVWPKPDGPMALQAAPQVVIATYTDPVLGSWLWLDAGEGHFGSWAAGHWTTQEPSPEERAAAAERVRQREEENSAAAAPPRLLDYPVGGPGSPVLLARIAEDDEPARCPGCRMPLTMHCEPGCSRPCGQCGESNAREAEEARLTIDLPPLLARPHCEQHQQVDRVWREAFNGLQVRCADEVVIHFRLTPQDGQAGD